MSVEEFTYKGKKVAVDRPDDQRAEVKIEDRTFAYMRHAQGGLPMWMCADTYFAAPELEDSIRHLIDYWHIVTDDEHRAPPVSVGRRAGSETSDKPSDEPSDEPMPDHDH